MKLDVIKEKAKTIAKMSDSNDTKALCDLVLKLVEELESNGKEIGFNSK